MDLSANATGSNGAAARTNTAGNAGSDGVLYSKPLEVVTVPNPFIVTGGNGSAGGADVADTGGSAGGNGGNGVNFSEQNGTALTAGNFTGLVNDSVITGGNGGNGSASGTATSGHVSGGNGGNGGNGVTAYANFSETSGTGTVTGGNGGTGGDTGGSGGFGGDGIVISNANTQFNSMGAIVGGTGGNGGNGNNELSGSGGYGGLGILVAASAATLSVNNNVTGGLGGNGGAASGGQAGMVGDGGYGIDIDALSTDANVAIGVAATILGGSIGINATTGSEIAAINGAVDGVGIGVEGTGSTITNNGTIEGGSAGAGVGMGIYGSTTQITNMGHVLATLGDSVRVEDYFNYGTVTLTTLDNTNGFISATSGNAIEVDGDIGGGHIGTLTNSGIISATSGDAILIDNAGGGGATIGIITNTGTISSLTGVALNVINGGRLTTLNNSGIIDGTLHLDSAGTFNNSGALTLSGGASTVGTLDNTGTVTIGAGKLTATAVSGDGTYTFQLTPGATTSNGTEAQLISGTSNLTGATIQVAPSAGSFVNDSLFEIIAGTGAVAGVTATPTDVSAAHGDTASYTFYDVLGGTSLSSAFGGGTVPGNADDVFIIAVKQSAPAYAPPVTGPDNFTGTENQSVTGNLLTSDTDPNGLSLNVVAATLTTMHGAVVENTDGTFTYTPATGYTGADSFAYTLEDSAGLTATGTASVTLGAPENSAPVFTGTANNQTLNAVENIGSILNGYGNDLLEGHNGNDTLNGGAGNEKLYGYYGNDYIVGGTGNDTLNGGPGNDTLVAGNGSDSMTGGGGVDHFVFNAATLTTGTDTITDFSASAGNVIDISNILSGHYNVTTSVLSNFVNIINSGSSSILEVDLTGHAGSSGWTHIATLLNETNLNEQTLLTHGNLIV